MEKERKYVEYDEAPSAVMDHPFVPKGAWYTRCRDCGLAEAAHKFTTIDSIDEIKAEHERDREREEPPQGRVVIGYYSDDNDDE